MNSDTQRKAQYLAEKGTLGRNGCCEKKCSHVEPFTTRHKNHKLIRINHIYYSGVWQWLHPCYSSCLWSTPWTLCAYSGSLHSHKCSFFSRYLSTVQLWRAVSKRSRHGTTTISDIMSTTRHKNHNESEKNRPDYRLRLTLYLWRVWLLYFHDGISNGEWEDDLPCHGMRASFSSLSSSSQLLSHKQAVAGPYTWTNCQYLRDLPTNPI